uniref:Uncharacterized protein n=1 Tax=Ceratitis capitata TaxID=7213 RepID=W8CC28_CERCA
MALPLQRMLALSPMAVVQLRIADRFTAVRAVINPVSPTSTISAATVARQRLYTQVRVTSRVCELTLRDNNEGQEELSVCAQASHKLKLRSRRSASKRLKRIKTCDWPTLHFTKRHR